MEMIKLSIRSRIKQENGSLYELFQIYDPISS